MSITHHKHDEVKSTEGRIDKSLQKNPLCLLPLCLPFKNIFSVSKSNQYETNEEREVSVQASSTEKKKKNLYPA